jgi:amino acid transporter
MLGMFLTTSPFLQFIVLLAMSFWFFGWAGTVFLSSTRVIFAAAFDRILPEAVASVEPRTRTPIWAMALMVVPGLIVSYLFIYNVQIGGSGFSSLTLASTLVIAVTFLGSTIAAILLPYIKPDLYKASPIAKYKVLGLPAISVAGVIFGAFLVFLLYQWLIDPNALYGIGIKNTASMVFMGAMYLLALVIYIVAMVVRRRQGIDLNMVYKEIPAE